MRVLLTSDTIGGVWTYTKELTEGLLERAHAVALVSFGRAPSSDQASWCSTLQSQYPASFEYTASETPLEWMEANETAYSAAEDLLLDLAHRFRADLLHTNQFCFGRLPLPQPKLVAAHSDVLSWAAACRPLGLDPSPWLDRYVDLVQTGLLHADAVVAPTQWMIRALAQNFNLPEHTRVCPNGRTLSPSLSNHPRKLQAVSAGRVWDDAKGLRVLTDVRSPFPLLVAGESQHGSQSTPPPLGDAHLLGFLSDHALLQLFRESSIYLALSIYEPFGLAPLEAALCGCAIIARDIPSLREVWGDAVLYIADSQSLSSLLFQLASSPDLLEQARIRANDRAQTLTRARMTECYLDLYRHLLDPARPVLSVASHQEVSSHVA